MKKLLLMALAGSIALSACDKKDTTGTASSSPAAPAAAPAAADKAGAPAADTPCDAVVAKLASYEASAGEPEKKLWTKMCAELSQEERACIVASKSTEERDACLKKDKKLE